MSVQTGLAIVLLSLGAGCSGNHPGVQSTAASGDSIAVADSTAPIPAERALTYEQRQGKALYDRYCAICHGAEGKGDGFNAYNLEPRPRDFTDSAYVNALGDRQMIQTISGGGRSVNKSPLMPAYGWTLKKDEIRYVASYVGTFHIVKEP